MTESNIKTYSNRAVDVLIALAIGLPVGLAINTFTQRYDSLVEAEWNCGIHSQRDNSNVCVVNEAHSTVELRSLKTDKVIRTYRHGKFLGIDL